MEKYYPFMHIFFLLHLKMVLFCTSVCPQNISPSMGQTVCVLCQTKPKALCCTLRIFLVGQSKEVSVLMKMLCLICIKKNNSISWSPGKVVQKYSWVAGFSISKCFRNISCHHPSNSTCDVIRDGKSELSFRLCNYLKQILPYFLTELVL